MQKLMKSFYKSSLITSIALFVIGLLLLFKSQDTIIVLSYLLGGVLFILGIVAIVNFFRESSANLFNDLNIVYGIVTLVLGILIIMHPTAIATFIPFVVGIGILVNSAIKLTYSMEAKNNGEDIWKSSLVMSVISALCGIIILFNPFETSVVVFQIIGAFICIYALLDIIYMFQVKRNFNEVREIVNSTISVNAEDIIVEEKNDTKKKATAKKTTAKKPTAKKTATKKTTKAKKEDK